MPVIRKQDPTLRESTRPHLNCGKICGRADLLQLLELGLEPAIAASLLGFEAPAPKSKPPKVQAGTEVSATPRPRRVERTAKTAEIKRSPIWRALGPVVRQPDAKDHQVPPLLTGTAYRDSELDGSNEPPPPHVPILPPARLGLVLRSLLLGTEPSSGIDEPKLVALLSCCLFPTRVPLKRHRAWPHRIQIFWDQSRTLWPFRQDQAEVIHWVRRWYGTQRLEEIVVDHLGNAAQYPARVDSQPLPVLAPDAATTILALSDLGSHNPNDSMKAYWASIAKNAKRVGAKTRALVLSAPDRWDADLVRAWRGVSWENARAAAGSSGHVPGIGQEARSAAVDELLRLLSPSVRIEWGLLTAVRRRLLHHKSDVLTEIDASMDARTVAHNPLGLALSFAERRRLLSESWSPQMRDEWRSLDVPDGLEKGSAMRALDEQQKAGFKAELVRHHRRLSPVILAEELMELGDEASCRDGCERLARYLRLLFARGRPTEAELRHAQRLTLRQAPRAWNQEVKAAFWALHHAKGDKFDEPLPDGLEMWQVAWALSRPPLPMTCKIWQRGEHLYFVPARVGTLTELQRAGQCIADLPVAARQIQLEWHGNSGRIRADFLDVDDTRKLAPFRDQSEANQLWIRSDLGVLAILAENAKEGATEFYRDEQGLWLATDVQAFEIVDNRPSPIESVERTEWHQQRTSNRASVLGAGPIPIGSATAIASYPRLEHQLLIYPPWATRLDKDDHGLFAELHLTENLVTKMRWIPPGRFLMGSPKDEQGRLDGRESPQHWVTLTQGFWLADAPCTQAEWLAIIGQNPSHFSEDHNCPVEQVSWEDCQDFCKKLRERFPDLDARLPTEAEWEYACRAGTIGAYNDGSDCTQREGADPALLKLGWFIENSEGKTHPVRQFIANAWGIHDMHGNVWEWCSDYWQDNYAANGHKDLQALGSGYGRASRGGCWDFPAGYCRSAFRYGGLPSVRSPNLGFRVAAGHVSPAGRAEREPAAAAGGGASSRLRHDEGRGVQAADGERSRGGELEKRSNKEVL